MATLKYLSKVIKCQKFAREIRAECETQIMHIQGKYNLRVPPKLAYILVGTDPNSLIYIKLKTKACSSIGIAVSPHTFPSDTPYESVLRTIWDLNQDPSTHGIIVQLPLPADYPVQAILDAVSPTKDLDCLNSTNFGKLALKGSSPALLPCTPQGCLELLKRANVPIQGKHAVLIGRSNLAGLPLSFLLQKADATTTLCHSRTVNLKALTVLADILCVAVGKPLFVTGDMVKPGAVVLDIGINTLAGKLVGDVDFHSAAPQAQLITRVPGGVGPLTVACLVRNLTRTWVFQVSPP